MSGSTSRVLGKVFGAQGFELMTQGLWFPNLRLSGSGSVLRGARLGLGVLG